MTTTATQHPGIATSEGAINIYPLGDRIEIHTYQGTEDDEGLPEVDLVLDREDAIKLMARLAAVIAETA